MLHLHILSWVLAIILFITTYLNISKNQGGTPYFKPLHMILRLFMLLTLISGFWILIQSFMNGGANHMLLTLKMLCGVAVVGLMEVSIAKRKRHEQSHTMFWITIALIIITMVLGVILPLGPISKLFGIG
ncbi:YisL family protein [Staphylococcus aureus]|uniref:YisL family protein n=1 Tax=Staphylococcus aureus TaxID=1280 RepID=UPI001CC5ECC6|nr:YisL family protein [Staphylococcus aureus]MBZ5293967.1 YisL family protein [Staphylococcus aureus]